VDLIWTGSPAGESREESGVHVEGGPAAAGFVGTESEVSPTGGQVGLESVSLHLRLCRPQENLPGL